MTRWIEDSSGGRDRGPRAIARTWVEVLVRPYRFFRAGIAPGDQAPGLVFAILVVWIEEVIRVVLVADPYPVAFGAPVLSTALGIVAVVLFLTPVVLHLVAGLQTVFLAAVFVRDRANISESVQVLAYASAPCVFAGVPVPEARALCGIYATFLLVVGLRTVHSARPKQALLAAAVPAWLVFGLGFRAAPAIGVLLRRWYLI
jgi:hypothetical protein